MKNRLKDYFNLDIEHDFFNMFIKFLYENKAYSNFMYNFAHADKHWVFRHHYRKNFAHYYEEIVNDYISDAFLWKHTPEGNDFWSVLDIKWRKKIRPVFKNIDQHCL